MTRSKIITVIIAATCGLALQFQASGANANAIATAQGTIQDYVSSCGCMGTYVSVDSNLYLSGGGSISSPNGNYLTMQTNGNLVYYDFYGNVLWVAGDGNTYGSGGYADFAVTGDLQVFTPLTDPNGFGPLPVLLWDSQTAGTGGYWLVLQDDGNLVIYDYYATAVWAASWDPNYNEGQRCSDLGVGCVVIFFEQGSH